MKMMLVDDSSAMRRIQRNVLKKLGITDIDEAGDGAIAIEKLAAAPVDCILLDWNMPNMDGLTCLKQIRSLDKIKGLKVIMCTSESEKTKIVEAIKAGANNYVVKPFTPEVLKEKLVDLGLLPKG